MPSWLLILFERVARARRAAGRPVSSLGECWENLGAIIHGGVSFAPYRATVEEWMGRSVEYVEVYPASEGFVGLQTERPASTRAPRRRLRGTRHSRPVLRTALVAVAYPDVVRSRRSRGGRP